MGDPDLLDRDLAGLGIDFDLADQRRVGERHGPADRGTAVFPPAPGVRDGIEGTLDGERASAFERRHHRLFPGQALILGAGAIGLAQAFDVLGPDLELFRRRRDQHRLQVLGRIDRGVTDHVGHPRGIRAVVLGRERAVRCHHVDPRDVDPQHLGDALGKDGGRALADSAAPVSRVIEASQSSFRLMVACGSPVQCLGLEAPDM